MMRIDANYVGLGGSNYLWIMQRGAETPEKLRERTFSGSPRHRSPRTDVILVYVDTKQSSPLWAEACAQLTMSLQAHVINVCRGVVTRGVGGTGSPLF